MYNTFHFHKIILVLFTLVTSTLVQAQQSYTQLVANNQLTEVANTLSLKSDDSALETINNLQWSQNEKKSALLLNKLGCLTITDISQSNQSTDVENCPALKTLTINHPKTPASLTSVLNKLLKDGVFQGYNIKEKSLVTSKESGKHIILYGHSSLIHAKQLITLLTINNINFTWQLIPKNSSFNIREDWQDIKPEEEVSKIRTDEEYDVRFTFATQVDQDRFMPLINQYAKKDNEDETGLIIHPWWQPFYRTFNSQSAFVQVKRISLQADGFVGSTLILPADANTVLEQISNSLLQTNIIISSEDVWVNPAFYRYLQGDYQ
jgi:hypothetical protein